MNANTPATDKGEPVKVSGLWMDQPDALFQLLTRAGNDVVLQKIGRDLIEDGFTVISGLQDTALIEQTNFDYDRWLENNREEAEKNRDPNGRQYRLTNFHLASPSAMKLAKNAEVMRILDFIFGREAAVHTSLTFQYSTMQALHRDAPYFHTFPENQFVGVWTALQDIDPDSGPLSYVRGSHRFAIDQHAYYREALEELGDPELARRAALSRYQNEITAIGEAMAPRTYGLLKRGDVAIWHPQLVHGGSPAKDPTLKRRSMVVHCCPVDTYVYIDDAFLAHQEETPPTPYYKYASGDGRAHGDFNVPGFMTSI